MALIPAMHAGRGHGTQGTARAWGGRRELELESFQLHGHGIEMHGARGREERLEQLGICISIHVSMYNTFAKNGNEVGRLSTV